MVAMRGGAGPVPGPASERAVAERLLAGLSDANEELMRSIVLRDREGALRTLVRRLHALLSAESSAIFTVNSQSRVLVLEAEYSDKRGFFVEKLSLPIRSRRAGGLTAHLADAGKTRRLHGQEVDSNPFLSRAPHHHLVSGRCYSVLAVPIKDKRGDLIALVKVDNKKDESGSPSPDCPFSEVDELIATILASRLGPLFETLRTSEILRGLIRDIHDIKTTPDILNRILSASIKLLGADRGDLALQDSALGDLFMHLQDGRGTVSVGERLPQASIMRHVWASGEPVLAPDISRHPRYFTLDSRTRSEAAVPIEWEGKPIGVLNAESFNVGGFDEQDIGTLQLLASYAAIAYQTLGRQSYLHGIVQRLDEAALQTDVPTAILGSARALYGFYGGILYIPDYGARRLRCVAFSGEPGSDVDRRSGFAFKFRDKSLATRVFTSGRPYSSPTPRTDRFVNKAGLDVFNIRGSVLGTPLIHEGTVVGVLVAWRQEGDRRPVSELVPPQDHFMRLAGLTIAVAEAERQLASISSEMQRTLRRLQKDLSLDETIHMLLASIRAAEFDRVRLFKYDPSRRAFLGAASLGMPKPSAFRRVEISIDANPYARHTAESALIDPSARRYQHVPGSRHDLGPDPHARHLSKGSRLPWAVVPLVISGELYGQIVVDYAVTKREITRPVLSYLTFFGALAAHAISSAEDREAKATALNRERDMRLEAERDSLWRELAFNAAHKFGAPVYALEVNLAPLQRHAEKLHPSLQSAISDMDVSLRRAKATVEQFKSLQRAQQIKPVPIDVAAIISESCRMLKARGVAVDIDIKHSCEQLTADPERLTECIDELLANAVHWIDPIRGIVTIALQRGPADPSLETPHTETVCLEVADNGPGVEPALKERIFKAFFTTHSAGTGLGLAFVKDAVEGHGGRIREIGRHGRGARFQIVLPLPLVPSV